MERIRIGCSGWNYKHWRERFYPEGLPQQRWFAFYAEHFDTVEINNSFYRLPQTETFMVAQAKAGRPVWAYFNNDIDAHAIHDAQTLKAMVARRRAKA